MKESYCINEVTCMPQVLKGKIQFLLETWASSPTPWYFFSGYSPLHFKE